MKGRRDIMKRRNFLKLSAQASILSGAAAPLHLIAGEKRMNILFFFSDDHSIQTLGAYKTRLQQFVKKHKITPNIDKLARQGALFENSFVCNSICGPSRAAILTGKHSHINGFKANGDQFDSDQWTMAKAFQKHGFHTAIFGKWHLGTLPEGFDQFMVLPGQGTYYNPDFIVNGQKKMIRKQGYTSDIISDLTIDWLKKKKDKTRPFFLCSWHKAPHRVWMPHPRDFNFLEDVTIPEPKNLFDDYKGRTSSAREQTMSIDKNINIMGDVKVSPPFLSTSHEEMKAAIPKTLSCDRSILMESKRMTLKQKQAWDNYYVPRNKKFKALKLKGKALVKWKYQKYMQDYIRCIKALDKNIGRVWDYLKKTGLDKNTIIVYSSDQGFYNGEHGWYDKRWMYEESLRNPFIIKWPGLTKPGMKVKEFIQNIDYAPTLLDAAGINVPGDIQGRSVKKVLQGNTKDWRKTILYTYYGRGAHTVASHRGVRDNRYKLIHFHDKGEWELFDLEKDPLEMKSEYKNPEYTAIVSKLKKELSRLMKEYKLN